MMTSKGIARVRQTDGNVYQVTYDGSRAMDRDVPWRYVAELVRDGYTVYLTDRGGKKSVGGMLNGEITWDS